MKTKKAGLLPASASHRKIKKSDASAQASYDMARQEAWKQGGAMTAAIAERAAAGESTATAPCSPSMPRRRKRSTSCPHGSPSALCAARSAPEAISRR